MNGQSSQVRLVECPRDAMQGWHSFIPTEQKTKYLNALLRVGFDTLDFGSFVSPKAIPQMADTAEVLKGLKPGNSKTRLLAIVANTRGAEEALVFDEISCLGFPFSLSATFQQRNTNSTPEESIRRVESILELCIKNRRQLVVYLSMGFGNPYGDPYDEETLLYWAEQMHQRGITTLSLADTVGVATPAQIRFALDTLIPRYPSIEIGVHLHSAAEGRRLKLQAAIDAGCRRIDSALKGIGGCPMAQDELVGNMDTEFVLELCAANGIDVNLNSGALEESIRIANEIFR